MNSVRSEHVRLSQSLNLQPLISSKKNRFSERNLFVVTLSWDLSGWNSFQVKSGNIGENVHTLIQNRSIK